MPFIGFIPVRDLAAARAFYEGTLGLRVADDTPFALVLEAGGTMLRVTRVPGLASWTTDNGRLRVGSGFTN